jgi:plastocyanin
MRFMPVAALLAGLCLGFAACGGGGGGSTQPSPTPINPNVITISSGGVVSPKDLTVTPGARVLFVNNDGRRHDMTSDDHPDHMECPAINQVGLLMPGQNRETGNLVAIRTCGFHDHEDPDNKNLRGQIVVR